MVEEKDRFGDKIHAVELARENQWARQRDEEILERLRRKYVKTISVSSAARASTPKSLSASAEWLVPIIMALGLTVRPSINFTCVSKV